MVAQLSIKLVYGLREANYHQATYHLHYKKQLEMKKSTYNPSFFWPTCKWISLLGALSHFIVKIINLLHNISKISTTQFAIYYLYYKVKFVDNLTQAFVCTTNSFYFLTKFGNLLAAFLLACNDKTSQPALVVKKKNCQKLLFIFFFIQSNFHLNFLIGNSPNVY